MKFIHIADVHFDAPFTVLNSRGLADERRLEQRSAFKQVIDYIKENSIPYLFISGDLFENEYVKNSTIEYINKLFLTISDTKIFIVPGNHDPYLKNSYYSKYSFPENVKIFTSELEKIEDGEINIYGYGFDDFYMKSNQKNIQIEDKSKINILITHCDLDGAKNNDIRYNPVSKTMLHSLGFDYVALGHIHKRMQDGEIVYPGSLVSLGFDELGQHGMILGEIDESTKELSLNFISVDEKEFEEQEIDISDIFSQEELIEVINNMYFPDDRYIKIVLIGNKKMEIEPLKILKFINIPNVIKVKDLSKLEINLIEIAEQNNLRGIFVRTLLEKIEREPENRKKIEKAIEIGITAF